MKKFKCTNCKSERETKKDVLLALCPCGYEMNEVKTDILNQEGVKGG